MFSETKIIAGSSQALGGKVQVCAHHTMHRGRRLTGIAVLGFGLPNLLGNLHTKQPAPLIGL